MEAVKHYNRFSISLFAIVIKLFLLCFICSFKTHAFDDYRHKKSFQVQGLSIDEGLSQSVVYDIVQDDFGYIWIATEDGLNRFDGYEFNVFYHKLNDKNSLQDNLIFSLLSDKDEGIWIGTQAGLSFYDFKSRIFTNYAYSNGNLRASVSALAKVRDVLYIGSDNGLYFLTDEGRTELYISEQNLSIDDEIVEIDVVDDVMWIVTETCVYSLDVTQNQIMDYCKLPINDSINAYTYKDIKYKDGLIWLATNKGLIRFNPENNITKVYTHDKNNTNSLTSNWIQDLSFDSKGKLWIASTRGVNILDPTEEIFTHFQHSPFEKETLSSNDVMSIFIDKTGLIWLGTYTGGVNILDPHETRFTNVFSRTEMSKFDGGNAVHGVIKDNNENIWAANFGGGLVRLNLLTGEITRPLHEQIAGQSHNADYPYSLGIDNQNRLWVGLAGGLVVADLNTNQIIPLNVYRNGKKSSVEEYVFQIYEDSQGELWMAADNGYFYIDIISQSNKEITIDLVQPFGHLPETLTSQSRYISCLLETFDGKFWFCGSSGLAMYDKNQQKWYHFAYDMDDANSLSNNDVQALYEDSRGMLWVATSNGLNKVLIDEAGEVSFKRIAKEQGLPNTTLYGVLEDRDKKIWLSTNLGLANYVEYSGYMRSYRKADGISSNEFNKSAYFQDENNRIFFGSINGVTIVNEFDVQHKQEPLDIRLTRAFVDERELDVEILNQINSPTITISENESTLSLSVSAPYYKQLASQVYRYRIPLLDNKWIYANKSRDMNFTGLDEGLYTLEIQSTVADMPWPSSSYQLFLQVRKNFWNTQQAFYLYLAIVFVLFLTGIVMIQRRYNQKLSSYVERVKAESLRLNLSREANEELRVKLSESESRTQHIESELDEVKQLVESYDFRERATGFIRYNNMEAILASLKTDTKTIHQHNMIIIFDIKNYADIESTCGQLASVEMSAFIAKMLKQGLPANIHLFFDYYNRFILVADNQDYDGLLDELLNLVREIEGSYIEIANDLTAQIDIAISYLDTGDSAMQDASIIKCLTELLLLLHDKYNESELEKIMEVILNKPMDYYQDITIANDSLVNSEIITLKFSQ